MNDCYNVFGAYGFVVFSLNECGEIDQNSYYAGASGFVDSTTTSNVTAGTTVSVQNADGSACFSITPPGTVDSHSLDMNFCGNNPAVQAIVSNFAYTGGGTTDENVVLFSQLGSVNKRFALVQWISVAGAGACAGGTPLWQVEAYVDLSAGTVDRTVVNATDAVFFHLENVVSNPASTPLPLVLFGTQADPVIWNNAPLSVNGTPVTNFDYYAGLTSFPPPPFDSSCELKPVSQFPIQAVVPGTPGHFYPSFAAVPASLTALQALGSLGQTAAWGAGDYVVLGDNSEATWNGTAWSVFN